MRLELLFLSFIFLTGLGSYWLPKIVSKDLYVEAHYTYDISTRFDNSFLTWGTDYMLAILTGGGALYTFLTTGPSALRSRCCFMLISCCVSVTVGGIAHQYFLHLDDLNTFQFRLLWSICVGFVVLTGGLIGSIGSHLLKLSHLLCDHNLNVSSRFKVIPEWLWMIWVIFFSLIVFLGGFSMKRPACDIFIAGITQTIPSSEFLLCLFVCFTCYDFFKIPQVTLFCFHSSICLPCFVFKSLGNVPWQQL